jgi:hypothetical protein
VKQLAEPVPGGDPLTAATYVRTRLPTRRAALRDLGDQACPATGADLLRDLGYDRRVTVQRFTGPPHPDRDRQFRSRARLLEACRAAGLPVRSVDTKEQELVGNFAHGGRAGVDEPDAVNAHDFRTAARCRSVPSGLDDLLANRGPVVVGTAADTPPFAAAAVARWWSRVGGHRSRGAGELRLLADGGGSNGCRPRRWKQCRQEVVADRDGRDVTGCHYPRGASKWNPVEHRLFGPISINWAGVPLRSPGVMLGFVRGTTTAGGLVVTAEWWGRKYAKGVKGTDAEMAELSIEPHGTCPRGNDTISPRGWEQCN